MVSCRFQPRIVRNDNGRRVNRDSRGETALHEKQERAEQSRFLIEALPEIFIRGDDFQPMINRDENRADEDDREGQPEVILHKPHPAFVGLPGRGEKRDRAGLRGHDREPNGAPANRLVAPEIVAEILIASRPPVTVKRDREQRADEHDIIDPAHAK